MYHNRHDFNAIIPIVFQDLRNEANFTSKYATEHC